MTVARRTFNASMNTSGTSASTITITKPVDLADGEMLLFFTNGPVGTVTPPDGLTLLGSFVGGASNTQSNLYKRIASSEPASYLFTFPDSGAVGVACINFIGQHDVLQWDAVTTTATATHTARRTDAARDALAYNVICWRDGASNTVTVNQGSEEFDIVAGNTALTIYRGISAALYGPGVSGIDDIVNIGDALPGTTFTTSSAVDGAVTWQLLIDNVAPDTEDWSSTDGDFAVELELDKVEIDALGGIDTVFRGDVTGLVSAFFESGENAPNETTEKLADGLESTKWLTSGDSGYVAYDFGSGVTKEIRRYRLTSGNDLPERDPMNWTLEGSQDNSAWTVLDTRASIAFAARAEVQEFKVATPGAYRYYKLNISSNRGPTTAGSTQLAEWRLSTHDVWEDVTSYVQEEEKIRVSRGFQGVSGRHDFSRAYCTFKNTDGRFSIRNQDGAYFGSLQRNTQMRISKAYGTKTLQLQGAVRLEGTNMCGDAVRCPLTDALAITGDIDIRVDLHPESWRDEQMLAGLSVAFDADDGWSLFMSDDGVLHLTWHDGTTFFDVPSDGAVPNVGRQAVRATLDVDNGASGYDLKFYTADTIAGPWTQLGGTVTGAATTSISYTGGNLCVGHVGSRDQRGIHGLVYGFELYDGIGGTAVTDVDFTALTNGVHEFEDSDGNRWVTINNAVISNRHYRFHGEVSEWPLYWDTTSTWIEVSATGAGVQKRLERGSIESSAFYRHHTRGIITEPGAFERFAEPSAYWPCEDLKNTIRVASGLPGKPGMEIYGTPEFESFGDFDGSKALPKMANGKFGGRVTGNRSGYADIRWIMHVPTSITSGSVIMQAYGTGHTRRWELEYNAADTWILRGYDEDDSGSIAWNTGTFAMDTVGEFMYCQMILDQNGANVDVTIQAWDEYGTSLGLETDSFLVTTIGRIYRININDDSTNLMDEAYVGHIALYDSADSPDPSAPLGAHKYESAAARVKRLCDEEMIEFRYVGPFAQSALMGGQEASAPFPLLSTNAVSDDGYLIDPLDAFGVEYKVARALYNQAAHMTFSYTGNELSGELVPTADDSYITNDFTASRGEAGSARFRRDDGALSVNAPPDGVGEYTGSQSFSFAHEGQCIQMASWQVHKGTLDEERFPRMELALENLRIAADTAMIEGLLTLDVGKRVDITDTPDFLPAEDIRQVVVGYEEWFDNFQHNFKLNCVPERWFEIAEYDAGWSFDAADVTLLQDVSSSNETLTVVTNTGQPLTIESKSYPFLVKVDGEQMIAIAPGGHTNGDPLFRDAALSDWGAQAGCTIERVTDVLHPNPLCEATVKVTPDGATATTGLIGDLTADDTVAPQNEYNISYWVLSPTGYTDIRAVVDWYTSAGAYISTSGSTAATVEPNQWTFVEETGVLAPATASAYRIRARLGSTPTANDFIYVWNCKLVEEPPFYGSDTGDSFNRADSTTTPGSTDRGEVEAWAESSGAWGISSNQLYLTAAATGLCTRSGDLDFEWMEVNISSWASGEAFLVFRYTDTSNYVRWGGTVGTDAVLVVRNGGVDTTYTPDINGSDWVLASGGTLAVRCTGSVIECFYNGELAFCLSDGTEQGTRIGVRTSTNVPRFDEFYYQQSALTQEIQVERGYNGVTAYHKTGAEVSLSRAPYRGL